MEYVIKNRQPADALRYFEELSQIPRGSGNEKAAGEYLMAFAKEQGLWCKMDELYNVYMKKPGSKGCEDLPAILFQGHTDMVCEKNNDVNHDFLKDPIRIIQDGDFIHAAGTTLGADNGVAVSIMMSLLARKDLAHPPIECLFTAQEEIGLIGAAIVDEKLLTAKRLINLDCGPEGEMIAGSAGGQRTDIIKEVERKPAEGKALAVRVRGLLGGHSGGDIDKERGNANKIMGRLLQAVDQHHKMRLVSIDGGSKYNAIPRECDAVLTLPDEDVAEVTALLRKLEGEIKNELAFSDAGFHLEIESARAEMGMMKKSDSKAVIGLLALSPSGVVAKSMALENLVVTSCNTGVLITDGEKVTFVYSIRSSIDSLRTMVAAQLLELADLFEAKAEESGFFPSWEYVAQSPLREQCIAAYQALTGKEMNVKATHGGLECGVFKSKIPELDIVAIGPTATGAHTPDEKLDLNSFERFYNFVVKVLEDMTK